MSAWQPIDTAPKDCTEVLVLCEAAGQLFAHIAFYRSPDEYKINMLLKPHETEAEFVGWWTYTNSLTQEKLEGYESPKFWMPLPEPPA